MDDYQSEADDGPEMHVAYQSDHSGQPELDPEPSSGARVSVALKHEDGLILGYSEHANLGTSNVTHSLRSSQQMATSRISPCPVEMMTAGQELLFQPRRRFCPEPSTAYTFTRAAEPMVRSISLLAQQQGHLPSSRLCHRTLKQLAWSSSIVQWLTFIPKTTSACLSYQPMAL